MLNSFVIGNIKIDFTFVNLVNSKNLVKRLSNRKRLNRYDKFKISFYKKVQKGFIKIAEKNKNKYMLVDSNKKIKINETIILKKINKLLGI